MGKQIV